MTWAVAVLSVAAAGAWYFPGQHPTPSQTVIRVGVDHSPPFYSIAPDGSVSGLAVDVFNEAARRRGIRLQWIPTENVPLEDILSARKADMWPLVGATAERNRRFFLSRPWLESDYVLVSL
ncbi:MAG TPA: transporter substrate-binding domain-containing protein, partial [Bryobacteraceae bacterium]|nr:transporter substrate-binding domain-containing protein [Bryobacteraceae bacterium]